MESFSNFPPSEAKRDMVMVSAHLPVSACMRPYDLPTPLFHPLLQNANLSMKYFAVGKVYTDKDGIKQLYNSFVHLYRKIILSLKLMDYLLIQPDKPWYNYYIVKGFC